MLKILKALQILHGMSAFFSKFNTLTLKVLKIIHKNRSNQTFVDHHLVLFNIKKRNDAIPQSFSKINHSDFALQKRKYHKLVKFYLILNNFLSNKIIVNLRLPV